MEMPKWLQGVYINIPGGNPNSFYLNEWLELITHQCIAMGLLYKKGNHTFTCIAENVYKSKIFSHSVFAVEY